MLPLQFMLWYYNIIILCNRCYLIHTLGNRIAQLSILGYGGNSYFKHLVH